MKRITLALVALSFFLLSVLPSRAQIKQEGWWIMDRVEILNKSDHPDFLYSPTSVTYRNEQTWSYVADRKGEDGKVHTISDVVRIFLSWGALPAHIQCGKETEISLNYSIDASPDTYKDKYLRSKRHAPFYSLEMRLQLLKNKKASDPTTLEWVYTAPLESNWGPSSGQFKLKYGPAGYAFSGLDVSKGEYELVLRIWADVANEELNNWDENKKYRSGYVIEHHYHYSRDMFDSMARP